MKFFFILSFCFFCSFASAKTWIFLGDSLTEGYGVDSEDAYPHQLSLIIKEQKKEINIINAGVSGSTTSSGIKRVKWYLNKKPSTIFLALGANDGLRGVPISSIEKNFTEMIEYIKSQKIEVILLGMLLPPNYGQKYGREFNELGLKLARKYQLKFFPFLLKDVGGVKELNLPDGIHPNEAGHKKIAQNIYQFIKDKI